MSSSLQVSDNAGIATSPGTKTEKSKASKKPSPAVTFQSNFSHILDARLLRGLSNLGHTYPTLVQAAAIPVALGGKSLASTEESLDGLGGNEDGSSGFRDLLVRARTGTGKTLAYGLPLMQKILDAKKALDPSDPTYRSTRALVLVPTRELSEQVYNQLRTLAEACGGRSSTSFSNAKSAAAHRQSIGAAGSGKSAGEDADGEEEGASKRGLKGKGKAKDVGSSSLEASDHNTTGEAPIEILNIARDDIKPKIIKMLLGRTGSGGEGSSSSRSSRHQQPDILVSTPSKLLQLLQKRGSEAGSGLDLSNLESLVIDEADFMLAYGHDMLGSSDAGEDGNASGGGFIKQVLQAGWWTKAEAKGGVQRFLISATLNSDVEKLKGLILRRPVVLDMKDSLLASASDDASAQNQQQLLQYSLHLSEVDKFLLLYVILKLRLIRGKTLIFVNSIERGYRLKLFLEQFGITKSAVLNHELPFNTRMKKVEAFNKDAIAVMIATDEVGAAEGMQDIEEEEDDSDEEEEEGEETAGKKRKRGEAGKRSAKKQKNSTAATEYSVSRGVDFLQVACVINFDMPTSLTAYTHRVGRTARAGNTGTALSFVVPKELVGKTTGQLSGKNMKHLCCSTAKFDESVWKRVQSAYSSASDAEKANAAGKNTIQEWKYDKAQIEAFRYRMEDALRSVTKLAIKDARVKELKWEMLNSEKLKSYWEDNPKDLEYLKAQTQDLSGGKMLGGGKVQSHLKHVPGYLMPRIAGFKSGNGSNGSGGTGRSNTGYVPKHGNKGAVKGNGKKQQGGRKKQDPLKKFKAK